MLRFGMRHNTHENALINEIDYPSLDVWTHYVMTLDPKNAASDVVSVFQNGVPPTVEKKDYDKHYPTKLCSIIAFGQKYVDKPSMGLSNNVVIDELLIFETMLNEHEIMDIYAGNYFNV